VYAGRGGLTEVGVNWVEEKEKGGIRRGSSFLHIDHEGAVPQEVGERKTTLEISWEVKLEERG